MQEYFPQSFLSLLPGRERAEFLSLGTVRHFTRDQHLTRIGEAGRETFVIISGCVKIFANSLEGHQVLLAVRREGDLIGELAVLDGRPRTATARAAGPVTTRVISSAEMLAVLADRPVIATAVRDTIAARLREAVEQRVEINGSAPVRQRLARALCLLGEQYGVPVPEGILIAAPLSQVDIGSLIATTEQSVRRALSALRAEGLVRWEYRKTVITDPDRLRAIAGIGPGSPGKRRAT